MNKYMAAGRHGAYRDNEFRERDNDVKGEYDLLRNGSNYERGKNRVRDSRGGGRARQKDVKEREMVNGRGYRSVSGRSYSGGSGDGGGLRRGDDRIRFGDREPGELSSESGSDEGIDSEVNGKNDADYKMDNSSESSLFSKKRKFSPIVWDRYDKEGANLTMTRSSPANIALPPPPPLPKSYRGSPNVVPYVARKRHSPTVPRTGNSPGTETCTGTAWGRFHAVSKNLGTFLDRLGKSTGASCTVSSFGDVFVPFLVPFPAKFLESETCLKPQQVDDGN